MISNRMDIRYLRGYNLIVKEKLNPKEACNGQINYDGLRILAVDEISIIQSDIIICAYQHCLSFRA